MKLNHKNTILVLGDSTSMSIGVEHVMHPFVSAEKSIWPEDTCFVNSSLPGMTAADAVTFYFRHKAELENSLRAVIIYLGNCDTASTEVTKGKVGKTKRLQFRLQEMMGKTPAKTSIKNRLLHFEWNNTFDPRIESPESGEDYEYNISQIIKDCESSSIPVVLVRPKANLYFPSGIGKGNFIFYRYFGINENISSSIHIPDSRFKQALALQESGKSREAAEAYDEILLKPSASPMSLEYSLLVSNNYAIAKAEAGDYEEALYLLNLLLKERDVRREIILFNIAYIKKAQGNQEEFIRILKESYEADSSLFRARSPYVNAVDNLSAKYSFVKTIDMFALIGDDLYLDHCHPLAAGQQILSDTICTALVDAGLKGSSTAGICNILYNPELGSGNISFFHDYFKTFAPFTEAEIAAQVNELARKASINKKLDVSQESSVSKELKTAIAYYFKHPFFTSLDDVIQALPKYPSDIGRFPEYFLVRHLVPYLKMVEQDKSIVDLFSFTGGLLRSSERLASVLPEKTQSLIAKEPSIDTAFEKEHVPAVITKVQKLLTDHLSAGNQVYERTKSTIFWYVRETLRFGSHARFSMRYDRLLLEFIAEGLAISLLLDKKLAMGQSNRIEKLISTLHATVAVHEDHCRRFSLRQSNDSLLMEYDAALKNILQTLTAQNIS